MIVTSLRSFNSAVGNSAGGGTTFGSNNTYIGYRTGTNITTGSNNTIMGYDVVTSKLTTGSYNILIGVDNTTDTATATTGGTGTGAIGIGQDVKPGSDDIAIGYQALSSTTSDGNQNTAIGYQALAAVASSSFNVGIGSNAGKMLTGSDSTFIGYSSGHNITSGTNNTVLGYNVGSGTLVTGSYNILIGTTIAVDAPASSSSNYVNIGNALDGTSGENSNTANAGIRSLGYVAEKNYEYITTGTASTVANSCSTVIFNPSSAIAAYTLTFPASPVDGQKLKISAGLFGVTSLTLSGNGKTIDGSVTTLAANTGYAYIYVASGGVNTWFRLY